MEIAGQCFVLAAKRHFNALDRPWCVLCELVVARDHVSVVTDRFRIVLEDWPTRRGVKQGGDEIAFACRYEPAFLFKGFRFHFAPTGSRGELPMHVAELA